MIEVKELAKNYGPVKAVDRVSFTIDSGEILGLLGPNGAGKTTIMKILTGYHYPNAGEVKIDGVDLSENPIEVKGKIGYLPEHAPLYSDLSVYEYLEFMAEARIPQADHRSDAIHRAVKSCSISDVLHRNIADLSKGYRQRVGLAQAILHDPEILILDEPTTGLDPNQIRDIRSLIKDLAKEKTIILSTHILQEVEALCDRVLIIHQGTLRAQGTSKSIAKELRGESRVDVEILADNLNKSDFNGLEELDRIISLDKASNDSWNVQLLFKSQIDASLVFDFAVAQGYKIRRLAVQDDSLEQVFAALTVNSDSEGSNS